MQGSEITTNDPQGTAEEFLIDLIKDIQAGGGASTVCARLQDPRSGMEFVYVLHCELDAVFTDDEFDDWIAGELEEEEDDEDAGANFDIQ